MAASVGGLFANLLLETSGFAAGLGKAEAQLAGSTSRMNQRLAFWDRGVAAAEARAKNWAKSLVSVNGIVGTLAGSAGLGLLVRRGLETAASIGEMADQAGVSTKFLQEMRHAASQSGAAAADFDAAITQLSQRLGDAKNGTGDLLKSLERLDPALARQVAQSTSVEQSFELVIGAARRFGTEAERNAFLADAFGRAVGVKMVGLVRAGAAGVDQLRESANKLGLVLDEQLIRNADEVQDKFATIGKVLDLKLAAAVVANADALLKLADAAAKLLSLPLEGLETWDRFLSGQPLSGARVEAPAHLKQQFELLEQIRHKHEQIAAAQRLSAEPGRVGAASRGRIVQLERELELLLQQLGAVEQMRILNEARALKPATPTAGGPAEPSLSVNPIIRPRPGRWEIFDAEQARQIEGFEELVKGLADEFERLDMKPWVQMMEEGARVTESVMTETERYNAELERLNRLLSEGAITQETFNRASKQLEEGMAGQTIGDKLAEGIEGAILHARSLDDIFQGILGTVQQIALELIQKHLLTPGLDALGGMLSDGIGSLFGGFFAEGGDVYGGKPIVVGEKGPEFFVPSGHGEIVPMSGQSSGGGVHVHLHGSEAVDSFRRSPRQVRRNARLQLGLAAAG